MLLKLFDFQMKNNLFQFIDLSNFKDIIKLDRECYFLKFDLKGMGLWKINAFTGKLGSIPEIQVKTTVSKKEMD